MYAGWYMRGQEILKAQITTAKIKHADIRALLYLGINRFKTTFPSMPRLGPR